MIKILGTYLASLVVAFVTPESSLAAPKQKPDAAINTRAIEASVTIDPALKAHRGLAPRLLAAGNREMAKWRATADKDYRTDSDFFRDGRNYSFARTYDERSVIQGHVSILRRDYTYSGGAHPNSFVDTLLWDTKAGKFISIRPFFEETATDGPTLRTLAAAVRAAVIAAKQARGIPPEIANDPTWLDGIKPDLTKVGGVALAPSTDRDKSSGLLFYLSPYAVGPYVEGSYTVFVPWAMFKARLSRDGAQLFGGTRPPGDAKHDAP
jgi:hypothetical protein